MSMVYPSVNTPSKIMLEWFPRETLCKPLMFCAAHSLMDAIHCICSHYTNDATRHCLCILSHSCYTVWNCARFLHLSINNA